MATRKSRHVTAHSISNLRNPEISLTLPAKSLGAGMTDLLSEITTSYKEMLCSACRYVPVGYSVEHMYLSYILIQLLLAEAFFLSKYL